mgnify:FL=1
MRAIVAAIRYDRSRGGGEDAAEAEPKDPADAEKAEAAGGAARRLGP